jgi:hypothetical protein
MVCHLFPSISPMNVWEIPWCYWQGFATFVDEYLAQQKEAARDV